MENEETKHCQRPEKTASPLLQLRWERTLWMWSRLTSYLESYYKRNVYNSFQKSKLIRSWKRPQRERYFVRSITQVYKTRRLLKAKNWSRFISFAAPHREPLYHKKYTFSRRKEIHRATWIDCSHYAPNTQNQYREKTCLWSCSKGYHHSLDKSMFRTKISSR